MVKLEGVTKVYKHFSFSIKKFPIKISSNFALKGINLELKQGDILALIGENGAGKTTLLKILATLIIPDEGRAEICGYDIIRDSEQIKKLIGLVNTNDRSFYWRLTLKQNLDFFATLYGLTGKRKSKTIDEFLEKFGLKKIADCPFMTLSSGQRQKTSLIRALLSNPKVLLLDEPTTNLDPSSTQEFIDLVKELVFAKKPITTIWCTHNLIEAQRVCNRFCILKNGQIITDGIIDEKICLNDIYKKLVSHN